MARLNAKVMASDLFGLLFAVRTTLFEQIEAPDTEPLGGLGESYRAVERLLADLGQIVSTIGRLPDRVQVRLRRILSELKDTEKPFRAFRVSERDRLVNMILDAGEVDNETLAAMVTARGIETSVVQVRTIRSARTRRLAPAAPTPVRRHRKKSRGGRPMTEKEKEATLDLYREGLTDKSEIKAALSERGFPDVTERSISMVVGHAMKLDAEEAVEVGEESSDVSPTPTELAAQPQG